jgi:arabinogalactan oligomer/maltooligosaccharide transport system permease protein
MIRFAGFTGTPAVLLKMAIIAVSDAILVSMLFAALAKDQTVLAAVIVAVLVIINFVYFSKKTMPFKFLAPGVILLIIFVVVPVVYTVLMSGYSYKTGNEISKQDAITQLIDSGISADAENTTFDTIIGKVGGNLAALATEQTTGQVGIATEKSYTPLASDQFTRDEYGVAVSADGFVRLSDTEAANADSLISSIEFPLGDGFFLSPQGLDVAVRVTQSLVYDKATDTVKNIIEGTTFKDNKRGNFANVENPDEKLEPGWRAYNNFENYLNLFRDPVVRGPFLKVFVWTFVFAFSTVIMMFGVGLLLAIAMDKKIRFRRFYRSILILPYAIPSFMTILIWAGMFNRQYGAVNLLLGHEIDWLNSAILAKLIILVVNLWLGFPYFYLISSGALQAIPGELEEAASIDGASPRQILQRIKMPLLLQILSPLLIASFAFNFNNFNIVYLLTGGGPTNVLAGETAGATDILITYTYKTAFGSTQQNLGLASAISMIMFIIVGALSMWSLKRSRVLENM